MSDRCASFARTAFGRRVIGSLGLPNPVALRRFTAGMPPLDGPLLAAPPFFFPGPSRY